ncbi:hypothetical protein MHYP_G00041840 [Metynnis hypsauchen]
MSPTCGLCRHADGQAWRELERRPCGQDAVAQRERSTVTQIRDSQKCMVTLSESEMWKPDVEKHHITAHPHQTLTQTDRQTLTHPLVQFHLGKHEDFIDSSLPSKPKCKLEPAVSVLVLSTIHMYYYYSSPGVFLLKVGLGFQAGFCLVLCSEAQRDGLTD